jgi:hypothetical protein
VEFAEASEVDEHARGKMVLLFSLGLCVQDEVCALTAEFGLDHQVGLMALAEGHVGEHFLVEKFQAPGLDISGNSWEKEFEEFHEKGGEEFFE